MFFMIYDFSESSSCHDTIHRKKIPGHFIHVPNLKRKCPVVAELLLRETESAGGPFNANFFLNTNKYPTRDAYFF